MNIVGWLDVRKLLALEKENFKLAAFSNSDWQKINCQFLGNHHGMVYRFSFYLMIDENDALSGFDIDFDVAHLYVEQEYHKENFILFHDQLKEVGKMFLLMKERYENESKDRLRFVTGDIEWKISENFKKLLEI